MKLLAILKAGGIGGTILLSASILAVLFSHFIHARAVLPFAVCRCGAAMFILFLTGYLYGYFACKADATSISVADYAMGGAISALLAGLARAIFHVARYYLPETIHLTPAEYEQLLSGSGSLFLPLLVILVVLMAVQVIVGTVVGAAGGMFFATRAGG